MAISKKNCIAGIVILIALLVAGPLIFPLSPQHRIMIHRTQFFLAFQLVFCLVSWYAWKVITSFIDHQSSADPSNKPAFREIKLVLKLIVALFLAISQFSFIFYMFVHQNEPHWFSWISLCCFGIYVQFVTSYFVLSWVTGLASFLRSRFDTRRNRSETKKSFIVLYISVIYTVALCAYGLYCAAKPPVIRKVDVDIKGLPSSMDGIHIALLSDFHFGSTIGKSRLEQTVDIVNSLQPDIVALVGDLTDGRVEQYKDGMKSLASLNSRLGKFFVSGNHEYYNGDVDNWFSYLTTLGFTVLHNSHIEIKDKGEFFYLAGTDDIEASALRYPGHGMDLDKAVGSCDKDRPIVLLAHQPKAAKMALESNHNIQLVLSGHTHGGQMMPMTIIAYLVNPFFAGLYRYNDRYVYVSQGTLYWGVPMRMFSESEIVHIYLRSTV